MIRKSIVGKNAVKRAIVMLAIAALALFSIIPMPVSAQENPGAGCPLETKYYGTINGGIYFEQYGFLQFGPMTKTFNDVPDGITFARVYTGVWGGSPGKGGDFNITINGGNTSPTYPACDPCPNATGCMPYQPLRCDTVNTSECRDYVTGCNVHFISYNATPYIVPGSNTITVKTAGNESCPRGKWDGRIYLIALLVVYEDASMPEMTYWINEGAPFMENGSDCDGPDDHLNISFYFNGTHISNPAKVKYWTLGFPHVANATTEPAYMKLNGNNIDKYDYMENYGSYEIFYRWDDIPPGYLNPSSNLFWYYEPSASYGGYGMFERVNVAVLTLERESPTPTPTPAPITEQWNMTFGGAGDDHGYSVQQTADGGYILAGDTRSYGAGDADVWLIKTDTKGKEQWSRTFGGAKADLMDRGSVRQTSDGGYVITGYTCSYGAGDADVWLIKTDENGIEQWNKTFGGDGLDWGHSVRQTSDGGYVIAGCIIPPSDDARADAWLIKTDSNGVEEWNRTFGADGCEYAASVQQTTDGGYIMTGRTTSFDAVEADAWLIRTDSNGIEQWNRTFGGTGYDYGYSVQQTADGGYVIAGSTNGRQDVWLIKTDSNGTEEWNTIFGFGSPAKADEGYSVQQTADGGYIIAGYTESYGTANSVDVWLIHTDSNGIEQWNMTVGGTGLEKVYSVQQTADGDYIAAGYTNSFGAGGYDMWLIKLSTPIVWQYEGLINPIDAERLANNNTLIAEFGNHSVLEVTPTGETVWKYGTGTAGSGANQLNCPTDAERLFSGSTLITDRNNHRVIEVTPAKEIVWQYGTGTAGSGPGQLYNPMDAERLSNGNTLIADRLNNRVIEVNPDKEIVWQYGTGTAGSGPNELNYPEDTERLSNNNTLITDSLNHRVIEVNPDKEIVWRYGTGTAGSGVYQLNHPRDAEHLPAGNTLIADWDNSRIIEVCAAPEEEKEEEEEIDLLPTALEIPPTPYANLSNTIRATIKNNGTGDASSLFNVSLSADGSLVDKASVSGLNAGESVVVRLYWTPSSTGDFELCVMADCDSNVNESEEGNNVLCETVTVLSFEHPCWNDSFDDATRIAAMQHVIVHEGDVKHEQKSHGEWVSDPSLVAGLYVSTSRSTGMAIAFNITGDGRWNLISRDGGGFYGFYWNDTLCQWVENPSLVAGLEGGAPAFAFNITGDGRWNLITGGHGYYWNDSQWVENPSLVAGLEGASPAIAFNITGDGRWNLIAGEKRGFSGWYWDGSSEQWVSDSSLVAGLPYIYYYIKPTIAFNLTGDGRWNLIAGEDSRAAHGYSWDGSQWISDYKVPFGLCFGYYSAPAIAFNITGDGMWNLIVRGRPDLSSYVFSGYRYQGGYIDTGSVKSVAIQPSLAYFKNWAVFNANDTVSAGTNITYKILDTSSSTIMTVVSGQNISGITQTSIRLYAELTTTNISYTPMLHDWDVCWATGEVDLLPTAIETPAELYANVTTIGAVIANHGDVHSGSVEFNVTLHANEVEVDSKRVVVDDMPPGWSTNVMFYGWTPPHAGTYNLTVIVDSEDEIVESNEGNNERTKEVTVLPSRVWRLTVDPNSSINPNIATDSEGNLHVVWYDDLSEGSGLYYKKLAPNGTVLVDDKRVSPGSGARIAVDSRDEVHMVFNNATNSINVSYMKLDNLGNTLIEPKQVISGVCYESCGHSWAKWNQAKPCGIAVDGSGEVHVVACCNCGCRLKQGDRQDMKYVKLDNEGNELVNYTIEHLTTPGASGMWDCLGMPPSGIAVDTAGSAYTAYSKGLCGACGSAITDCWWPSCLEAYYVKIDSEGVHKQELTGDLPLPSLYPAVCVDSGDNKYVVWSQHNRTATIVPCGYIKCRILHGFDFYLTKFDKSGNKVIDRKRLTFEDYPVESGGDRVVADYYVHGVRRPVIDTESGVIHAAWSVPEPKEGENGNIWYMAFDTSGDEITNKTLISFEDGDSWEPGIDACSDGAHLVWTDNRDENNEIYYAKMFLPPNRVFILCPSDKWTLQNVTATYAIGILHTMPNTETFNLTRDNLDGADDAELNKSTITLNPNTIGEVILNVTDAVLGDYRVNVSVESQTNPGINASATITTSVITSKPDLVITAIIDVYHHSTAESPWFNLSNEVDVEVKNIGTADAGSFNVSSHADGEYVDKKKVSDLGAGSSTILQLNWIPIGADCFKDCTFTDTSRDCNLTVAADCDNEVNESDETNNNLTKVEKAYYNGYIADEPLENVFHGTLRGGLLFTTGDGAYSGLYGPGDYKNTTYEITLPAGASVVLARLNVYYTWHYEKDSCPAMEVSITNETGTYVVPLDRDYNDIKCQRPGVAWVFPWGNYVYNLTPHIQGSGTYMVTVKRTGGPSFCIAAPGIEVLYQDETKPLIEYWINEGADVLIGGRRSDGGYLSLEECINNATFPGNVDTSKVENATLGVVSPWAGSGWTPGMTNYLYFNDFELGCGVYHGYSETYSEAIGGISMHIGSTGAQVGVNLSDVTDYLRASDNRVGQGDDGDNMMPCNAFLVVEYEPPTAFKVYGWVNDSTGAPVLNPNVTITNLNTSEVFIAETNASSNYYQVVTSSWNVSAGNVLHFYASNGGEAIKSKHRVTEEEMDKGGLFNFNLSLVTRPQITAYAPETPVSDFEGVARTFNIISVSQTVNVSWQINGTEVQCNFSDTGGVTEATYTNESAVIGTWNVSAIATNANGSDMQMWIWNVAAIEPPEIIAYAPETSVSDIEGAARTFNIISVSQTVNVSWQINGTQVQCNFSDTGGVTEASYTNASAVIGTWNVSAIATNANGSDMQTWWWTVSVKDITPPASITNLHNTSYERTHINWSWTNPADADFNYTRVYLNGTRVTNTSYPFYNATGFSPDTAYEIGTRTVDKTGNVNLSWMNHSARTAPTVPLGVCGDVTGEGKVRVSDGRWIYLNQTYPGMYPVDKWAADVTGEGKVRVSDGRLIYLNQTYPGMYPLECGEI